MESRRPDLSLIVVSKATGLPRVYQGEKLDPEDERRIKSYRKNLEDVYEYWGMIGCDGMTGSRRSSLPYDMGNAGDLLKHGVLAEFVR